MYVLRIAAFTCELFLFVFAGYSMWSSALWRRDPLEGRGVVSEPERYGSHAHVARAEGAVWVGGGGGGGGSHNAPAPAAQPLHPLPLLRPSHPQGELARDAGLLAAALVALVLVCRALTGEALAALACLKGTSARTGLVQGLARCGVVACLACQAGRGLRIQQGETQALRFAKQRPPPSSARLPSGASDAAGQHVAPPWLPHHDARGGGHLVGRSHARRRCA